MRNTQVARLIMKLVRVKPLYTNKYKNCRVVKGNFYGTPKEARVLLEKIQLLIDSARVPLSVKVNYRDFYDMVRFDIEDFTTTDDIRWSVLVRCPNEV